MSQHEHFMHLALQEAEKALAAGDFPVGCVLVAGDLVLAAGHRKNSHGRRANEMDHAEILTLHKLKGKGALNNPENISVYSTMEPCLMCFSTLLLSGIRTFIWAYEDIMGGGTKLPLKSLPPLYREMKVNCIPGVLRSESLDLFQKFFRNHSYWQDSDLSRYTLAQEPGGAS